MFAPPIHFVAVFAACSFLSATAQAAEALFDGYYRAESDFFSSRSLNPELAEAESLVFDTRHRLLLGARLMVSSDVGAQVQIRALDGAHWGSNGVGLIDPVTGEDIPVEFSDSIDSAGDISVWRAWGEAHTAIGDFKFGRMPLHFGSGIWQNGGNELDDDYGDTADRVQFEALFDKVFFQLAYDLTADGAINAEDATTSYNSVISYRSETVVAGINTQVRRTPSRNFSLFTVDGAVDAHMGQLALSLEAVGQFGSGDLANGANDATISAIGTVVSLEMNSSPLSGGAEFGFATGDDDTNDQAIKTFAFDRDYDVALVMFEQTLPTLATSVSNATNFGANTDFALSGDAVSNAIYGKLHVGYAPREDHKLGIAAIFARTAKLPENTSVGSGYGKEVDISYTNSVVEHLTFSSAVGFFLPGDYYTQFESDDISDLSSSVVAGKLSATVTF